MKEELKKIQHARSAKDFPHLDLEPDEYVVLHITRSKIGLVLIWLVVGACIFALSFALIFLSNHNSLSNTIFHINDAAIRYFRLIIFALYAIIFVAGFIAQSVYRSNQMYITNHRAIQKVRPSPFVNSTNIIQLSLIEDVSFRQNGIFDHLLQIGTLRMSTAGDETTYTLTYIDTPHDEVKTISHLVYQNKPVKSRK
ncbi:PH domain-containing protein [Candidatus Saccharibacteria bacterium]|nr:PH domain-containing protein [Candidatus Saccharibacteria bacterium]